MGRDMIVISRRDQHWGRATRCTAALNDAIEVHRPPGERSKEKERKSEGRPDVRPLLLLCRRHASGTKRVSEYTTLRLWERGVLPSSLFLSFSHAFFLSFHLTSFVFVSRYLSCKRTEERASGGYNLPYTRAHNNPDRLGSGATIRCPTEKPASHGTGFRCTRASVRLALPNR